MASGSEKAAKLAELKKDVIKILSFCEGHRLDLGSFKEEFKKRFGKQFDKKYKIFKEGWKFKNLMAELDDVIDLEESENCKSVVVMKLKEPYSASRDSKNHMTSPEKFEASAELRQVNLVSSAKSPLSQATGKDSKTATAARMSSPNNDSSNVSDRTFLKAQRRLKKKSAESKEKSHEPTGENVAASIRPLMASSSSPESSALSSSASYLGLPLSPPPVSRLEPSGFIQGLQMTPPQREEAFNLSSAQASPSSLREIMEQQAEEERLAGARSSTPPLGYEKLLQQMGTPTAAIGSALFSPPDLKDARIREVGTPGPLENSISHAQLEMGSNSPKAKSARNVSLQEVNRAAEDIITSLSEEGRFVCLEVVKTRLCREFGKSSLTAMGFKRDTDIPALKELIQMQARVSLFVHAYIMTNSISTLYELNQSLADLGEKADFEDLKLGPLLQQPVVYDMFKAPTDLPELPRITTIQILKHLEKYMTKEDLWRKKVDLKKFMEYLCEEYDCKTPYSLGVRIQSIGLAISVIKKAKHYESDKWKAVREQVSSDMEEDLKKHLRKIKKDLLGQELGDLRSCVMKFLDTSPVDALNAVFNCCLQMFDGKREKKITKFLTLITQDSLGRSLFQLALSMSCKQLLGDTLEKLVTRKVDLKVQDAIDEANNRETKTRPVPPSEGAIVQEVKEWLMNADNIDLARLAMIEGNFVSKFPGFNGFEDFGYGSFLKFLTKHQDLLEAIEQVGGMARSGRVGTKFGHEVSLNSVLDFIAQCGTQTSLEIIERNLCSYYGVSQVTDLGFGSCSNLLKKAAEQKKNAARISTPFIVYEAALMRHDPGTEDSGSVSSGTGNGGVLGYRNKEEALEAIHSTPLLEDVSLWTHWDEVYGGDVSKLGDLKSFLENEGILRSAEKSSLETQSPLVVMETSPGVLLRVTTDTSPDLFKECACRGDAIGAAGHLVSMVIVNGGVANTPVALLANHVHSSLASMAADDKDGSDYRSAFVLECLARMPLRLARAIGTKVFLEPLKKLVGSTEAPSHLLSCSTQSQRSRLHQLGFSLGINQWIEDFQNRISRREEADEDLHLELYSDKEHKRPIAVVRPVASSKVDMSQPSEISSNEPENDMTDLMIEESADISEDAGALTSDTADKSPAQSTEQEEECRAVIEQIRREDFGIGLELGEEESKLIQRQREREGRGLHRLSTELYTRDTHFVLELVQNADDNSYPEQCTGPGFPSLVFVLERNKIVVLNNEVGFVEKNVRALCDVGRSTKGAHRYGYIGQKGIGFKSVFRVSDCPEVHSNGYHIRFDAKSGHVGYILPQWIGEKSPDNGSSEHEDDGLETIAEGDNDKVVDSVGEEFGSWPTRIVLPLKEEHQGVQKSSLAARFRDVHPSLLLFLHRLRGIIIHDKVNNSSREMVRRDLGDNIMELSHNKGTDRWLVIKKQLDASNMKEDVEMTELALAFPLFGDSDKNANMGKRHQTLPQQNVFAYLPLRSYGFRFIIQGDFEVPSSREDVDSDKSWNQWLREEIPQLFIDALSVFMDHSSFTGLSAVASYFQFVPLNEEILDFFTPVARHILKLLQGKPCIPVKKSSKESEPKNRCDSLNDLEWVIPCKAVYCEERTTQELITPALLREHLDLSYLHPEMVPALNPTLRSRLGIETLSSKHMIEIGKAEVKKASADNSAAAPHDDDGGPSILRISWVARWLQCMYRCLEQERNSSQEMLDLIESLNVIPLTDGTFVNLKGDSVFLPLSLKKTSEGAVAKKKKGTKSQDQTCFTVLERDLSTVHPALFSSLDDIGRSQVEQLLGRLGVKSWSARELINSHIIPTFKSSKWKVKANEVLRSYLVYILEQRITDPSVCDIDELRSCVQILTNKGVMNPAVTPVHFTPKYGNTIDLAHHLPSISWTVLDESYVDSCTTSKARPDDWKAFFAELGVQHFLAIERKQVKLHRNSMAQSPWATFEPIWQTTPDGYYIVDDWVCEEFEEFLYKIDASDAKQRVSRSEQSKFLAQCLDERWDKYAKYADGSVHVKDTNGHVLTETQSSFFLNLISRPWIAASAGGIDLFLPRDLFIKSPLVYQLLEDHVKYVAADLKSHSFISTLRIRESVGVDGLIDEMKQWSAACGDTLDGSQPRDFTTSIAHMSRVYLFLSERMYQNNEDRRKINDAFHKNALIFVSHRYPESSTKQDQRMRKSPGSFLFKKDVCWRDPTDVALKLLKEDGEVTTRRLLERHYSIPESQQPSLVPFFIDQLHVDETPNVDEYIEMASTVAKAAGFPTPSSLNDMLKIFATLGSKCVVHGHNDSMRVDEQIDVNMSAFVKQSLEGEQRCIFPSFDKWVALSDKPLLPDDKSLLRIFQKEKSVHFLDLRDFLQPEKHRSSIRKPRHDKEEIQRNVLLFLKTCEVKTVSECIVKEFITDTVFFECVPLQKHFHQMMPHVQRFLYSRNPTVYDELIREGFAQKLLEMQFASVKRLETVYSLSTHPDVRIPIEEKSGVESVGSTFCFYVVKEFLENADVINAELVKLLLRGKKQGSSDLSNFLVAVKNYDGTDLEYFLGEPQGLDPLPAGDELWSVPPPKEPPKQPDIAEVEEEVTTEAIPLQAEVPTSSRFGDDGLHSWPPKSAAQYDKTRQREGESGSESTLTMWPPPAPPESVKKPEEEHRGHQAQGRATQHDNTTERPIEQVDRPGEKDGTVSVRDHPVDNIPRLYHAPRSAEATAQATVLNSNEKDEPKTNSFGCIVDSPPSEDEHRHHNSGQVELQVPQTPRPEGAGIASSPESVVKQISPTRSYLWFDTGTTELDFEDLPFNGDPKILDRIPLVDNPNKEEIGRWGERCVFEFLQNEAKLTSGQVEIIWVNERGNTTAPYDIEIRQSFNGVENDGNCPTVITFVEVKTTSSDQKEVFELSVPELSFAKEKQNALHLYRVFNAGKPSVRIRRLKNLAAQLEMKTVKLCMVI